MSKTWFVTGAGRGIGAEIVKAALAAGDNVVATGRDKDKVRGAFSENTAQLLALTLDVTDTAQAEAAVQEAVARFGQIDVLVNNAGYGQLGAFEENSAEDIERQFATNMFGVFHVTRAVLPVMRQQRSGHIFNISSVGGIQGYANATLYCSSKFAVEGFSESLAPELAPFGIHVTIVEPGFFRTDFLDSSSVRYGNQPIEDYAQASAESREFYTNKSHQQEGDPAKLASALRVLADSKNPPVRFAVGTDAVRIVEGKIKQLTEELAAWQELSGSTDY